MYRYPVRLAMAGATKYMETFVEFPPAQTPGSFNLDQAKEKMSEISSKSS